MTVKIKRGTERDAQFGQTLTSVLTGMGLPTLEKMVKELNDMKDILMGRAPSPIDSPYLAMQEVATAYHSRACELDMIIHRGEREGLIPRGSDYYRFRTGELRSFLDLTKKCADLGSRRLTQEQLLAQQRLER